MTSPETLAAITGRFAQASASEFRGQSRIVIPRDQLHDLLAYLQAEQGFDFLSDVSCVDYLNYRDAADRFGLVYILVNTSSNERITVRTFLNEPDLTVKSAVDLWQGANWLEREVWDMFGIVFDGHPDHRRVLMPEEFAAFPLRKDYPLQGRGERHNFPVLTRSEG
jgi:NADH-quinone oxidoreductase subunit C